MRDAVALVAVLIIGCSSAARVSNKAPLDEPEVRITQTSRIPDIATRQSGPVSVRYRVDLINRSRQNISLRRIDLQTIGQGAYALPLLSRPFSVDIKPGESRFVELWGPAYILDPAVLLANGPVVIRTIVYYDAPSGPNQSVSLQQVFPPGD